MYYKPSHYFIFDTETGGLREQNPSFLTLDGIMTDSKLEPLDTISLKFKPRNGMYRVNAKAMEINGINLAEHGKYAKFPDEAAEVLVSFFQCHGPYGAGDPGCDKIVPVGQYLEFDMHFLKTIFPIRKPSNSFTTDQHEWSDFLTRRGLCTAAVSQFLVMQGKLPPLDCSLKSLAKHFDFDYTGAHNSAFDAELTRKVLKKLLEL